MVAQMNDNRILQPVASTNWLERALEQGALREADLAVDLLDTKDPEKCPIEFLAFLAWEQSISDEEGWAFAESEEARRTLIKRSAEIHKKKGTVWAIREVFRMLNLGEVEIIENIARLNYDGTHHYNAYMVHGDLDNYWATYIVKLKLPLTNDQAVTIRQILDGVAPARSELVALDYKAVAIRYNRTARYDGQYNYGSA